MVGSISNKTSKMSKLKATVAAQNKLIAMKKAKNKAVGMDAAANIIFNDDEDLDIQAEAVQSYLLLLESNTVKT